MRPTPSHILIALLLAACAPVAATGRPATLPPAVVTVQPTPSPAPAETATPVSATATAPPADECALFDPASQLLTLVDRETALPRDFAPSDLITLTLPARNDWILPLRAANAIEAPLVAMLDASNQVGLALKVVSAYRSYTEQALAFQKWEEWYPDRASALSAEPGHSEHQLGTAVDFTTPEIQARMPNRFHTSFAQTPEGVWLAEHAAEFGFTLSYPDWATEQTGYEWEPWHYRYVGIEVAQHLVQAEPPQTISAFIQACAAKS